MYPYLELFDHKILTFPLIALGAFAVCVLTYLRLPCYQPVFRFQVIRLLAVILPCAALGGRILSALTLAGGSAGLFFHYLVYGGAVFYGGLIGGWLGLFLVCLWKKHDFRMLSDVYASILPLGHGLARLGCFCNGCCYGCPWDGPLGVVYPVQREMIRVFPTWFAEAGFNLALFAWLQHRSGRPDRGRITGTYLTMYPAFRFLIEFFRGDEIRGIWGSFSTSQYISMILFLVGLVLLYQSRRQARPNYYFLETP